MSIQQRDGGMISKGIGRKIIQNIEPIVLSQMSMREPIKLSTTHFVFCFDPNCKSRVFMSIINS